MDYNYNDGVMKMIYVCSDLHGYPVEKFKELLASANFSREDTLYILGDVIDRGPESVQLLQWIIQQPNVELILGNHESMLLDCEFLFDGEVLDNINNLTGTKRQLYSVWISNGGYFTFNTLSVMRESEIKRLFDYLRNAPLYKTVTVNNKSFILVHSGLGSFNKDKKLSEYSKTDLLWNRPSAYQDYYDDAFTVFGHTPTIYCDERYKGRALKTETWIDIDVGVSVGFPPMLLRLDDMKQFYVK